MIILKKHFIFSHVEEFLKEHYNHYDDSYVCVLGYLTFTMEELIHIKMNSKKIIIYQLEQISNHLFSHNNRWVDILKFADLVLEYDENNKLILDSMGIKTIIVKLKYTKSLNCIQNKELDIDVLFYGSINQKRKELIDDIINENPHKNIVVSQSLFGEELDLYISRSKIILNCHYYDMDVQEQVRIFYPLINNKVVVSEYNKLNNFGDSIYNVKREYVGKYIKDLLETCRDFKMLGEELGDLYRCL
jgi:hypothetical protein